MVRVRDISPAALLIK